MKTTMHRRRRPATGDRCRGPAAPLRPRARDRAGRAGDVIVKFVNSLQAAQTVTISLQGIERVGTSATLEVLAGRPEDENTAAEPMKIVPKTEAIGNAAARFTHQFPGYSVSVLRIKTR